MKRILLLLLLLSSVCFAEDPPRLDYPRFPLGIKANETVELEVRSKPGQTFVVETPDGKVTLQEREAGHYWGAARLKTAGVVMLDGRPQGEVTLLGDSPIVETMAARSIFRAGPDSDFERYDPVVAGVRFAVKGRQGDWLHVSPPDAWIENRNVKFLPSGTARAEGRLNNVIIHETAEGGAEVRVHLTQPCAWQIDEEPEQHRMWVHFPGVPSAMHEMAFPQQPRRISSARIHPEAKGSSLELVVQQGLFGYTTRFEGEDLILTLLPPILKDASAPLRGVRITLDAGHGGTDQGAIGLHGRKEKELNLNAALALQKELQAAGALVTMTRDADHEVAPDGSASENELGARVSVAEQSGAQIFVSIHHNAMPDVAAGRLAHGTHVYYYQPQSQPLAAALAEPVAQAIGESSYMHLWRSFAVIRQASMPAVLVEVNFISNPQLETGMEAGPDYSQRVARGIRTGLEDYVRGVVMTRTTTGVLMTEPPNKNRPAVAPPKAPAVFPVVR